MRSKIFLAIFIIFALASFVSAGWPWVICEYADLQPAPPEPFKDRVIWNLPELSGYTYGGRWDCNTSTSESLDLRYSSPVDGQQHSEFYIKIYDNFEEANNSLRQIVEGVRTVYDNVSIIEINGNKVFEATSIPAGARYLIWISGNNTFQAWGGNDMGTVIDTPLFNTLTNAYLIKYPSTYGCENGNCNELIVDEKSCCNECVQVHSAISGSSLSKECIALKEVDLSLPYHLSNECKNYFQESPRTISKCIGLISLGTPESNATFIYIKPNETTGPVVLKNYSISGETEYNKSVITVCDGCELDKKCYPFGYRKAGKFCSDAGSFVEQLDGDKVCENNFECKSNVCVSSQCVSEGLLQKILNWFTRLFG